MYYNSLVCFKRMENCCFILFQTVTFKAFLEKVNIGQGFQNYSASESLAEYTKTVCLVRFFSSCFYFDAVCSDACPVPVIMGHSLGRPSRLIIKWFYQMKSVQRPVSGMVGHSLGHHTDSQMVLVNDLHMQTVIRSHSQCCCNLNHTCAGHSL